MGSTGRRRTSGVGAAASVLVAAAFLAGCALPRPVQRGLASYHAPGVLSRDSRTASGEKWWNFKMVAAHRTLPMGSIVRVTNLENGRSVKVRIIDRGPYIDGRIIDLSPAAADRLGFRKQGLARVKIEVLRRG